MALGILSILAVVVITILVAAGKIKERYYPYYIAIMALGLVYSTTMLGTYTVGTDIQGELGASRSVMSNGWNFLSSPTSGGNITSIVTGFFAPLFSRLTHMDIVWIYKAILPLFLVGVPTVLYYVFRKQIGGKRAFFATLFFIIVPVFSLEIAAIAKSMVAEFFFALMILAIVSTWEKRYKVPALIICLTLTIVCHYTIGLAALAYLLGIIIIRLVTSKLRWKLFILKRIHLAALATVFLLCSGAFFAYYHVTSGGVILKQVFHISGTYSALASETVSDRIEDVRLDISNLATPPAETPIETPKEVPDAQSYLYKQGHLVLTGTGLDFAGQLIEGKVFRIVQYLTQILIITGAFFLIIKPQRYKFTAEFTAGIGCSFMLLLCCVFVPHFDSIINMSRFYHISLFFLAPMFVIGCEAIGNVRDE